MATRTDWTDARLSEFAQAYTTACERGLPVRAHLASVYGLSLPGVSKVIRKCRDQGLLAPPPSPTSSPRRHPRAIAVAKALGVDYEDLVRAVRDHADGDLRVGR